MNNLSDNITSGHFHSLSWPDRVIAAVAAIAGVLNLYKDVSSSFGYVLLALMVALLLRSWVSEKWLEWRREKTGRTVMHSSLLVFRGLVSNAEDFFRSTNTHSIPYYIQCYLDNTALREVQHPEIENLLIRLLERLEARTKEGFKTFSEFEVANQDLYEYLNAYSRIYLESLLRTLKQKGKYELLTQQQKNGLNTRFQLFRTYLQEYNSYRKHVAAQLGETTLRYSISIPTENLD